MLATTEARAAGVVTDHASRRTCGTTDHHTGLLVFPSVRFRTQDGRTVEFQNEVGSNAPPPVGDQVTVLYDPARPEDAKVALSSMFRIDPRGLLVAGAIFLAALAFFFMLFVAVIVRASVS